LHIATSCSENLQTGGLLFRTGLPEFSWYVLPKPGKMCQINTKCTKWSENFPNVRKVIQMVIKYVNIFQSRALKNYPNWDFCLKMSAKAFDNRTHQSLPSQHTIPSGGMPIVPFFRYT
jgi:hypothetical protein